MSANPSAIFYWNDWENDEGLKLCSLAAQGFWMRCLCIAARSTPRGYLAVNGRPLSCDDLAKLTGIASTEAETLLSEILERGVASRTHDGRIYNRRMVRDAKISRERAKSGREGGRVTAAKKRVNSVCLENSGGKILAESKLPYPLTPNPSPPNPLTAQEERAEMARRIAAALGVKQLGELHPDLSSGLVESIMSLQALGCDWMIDIVPALAKRPSGKMPRTKDYWLTVARSNAEKRAEQKPLTPISAEPGKIHANEAQKRAVAWIRRGVWSSAWGPKEGEPGCCITAEQWADFRRKEAA